jgi:hypothetical protein
MESMDDIPNTHGLTPPTPSTIPGRLLAVEVRTHQNSRDIAGIKNVASRLVLAIIGASLTVTITVVSAAIYVGGQFRAVAELDRRVVHLERR